ncbi:MAG: alkaline phosphatase family protein [Saprospiraceae bacterium]|nr:alkaline phosphatase family protein [Saprospiraceae bacterium]
MRSFPAWYWLSLTTLGVLIFYVTETPKKIKVAGEESTVTYILIDGLSDSIFRQELHSARLPNINKFIARSLYVENGISSFTTMTGYAFYPFITGRDASESGIYGLRWFDKKRTAGNLRNYVGRANIQMNHDIEEDIPTAFELADGQFTCSINSYMNRGVGESIKTGFAHTTAKYEGLTWFSPLVQMPWIGRKLLVNHFQHETEVTNLAIDQLKSNPKVQWITYPSPDAYNHVHGTDSIYHHLLRHLDYELGRLCAAIDDYGHKNRVIALISDHGIADVHTNTDLCASLQKSCGLKMERGRSAVLYSTDLNEPLKNLKNLDAYFVINGNLSAYIYALNGRAGKDKADAAMLEKMVLKNGKTINLPREVVKTAGINFVSYYRKSDSTVVVLSKAGTSHISKRQNSYLYQTKSGPDPLGFASYERTAGLMDGKYHTDSIWLAASATATSPDALNRLFNLMSKEKSGDILITALPGFDLASNYEVIVKNYKGGHGGLDRAIMIVPYMVYFPGRQPDSVPYMRSETLGKMILDYVFPGKNLSGF